MDFLQHTVEQNPALVRTAIDLHQQADIPPNTVVIDLETVRQNADEIRRAADEHSVSAYAMTKQFGRNPLTAKVIEDRDIGMVAVDIEGTKSLHRHGISVDHVGHLCQVPDQDVQYVVEEVTPEVITVFSVAKAEQVARAASNAGRTQKLLVRVIGEGDIFYPYQEGGFHEDEVVDAVEQIHDLDGVRVAGVTSFPTVRFNIIEEEEETLSNFETLIRTAERIESELGIDIEQINAPADTSSAVLELLAKNGATHGEPGHGFFGTTPWHFFDQDLPENPAWVYVSEVSHEEGGDTMVYGGALAAADPSYGFWTDKYQDLRMYALIGDSPDAVDDDFALAEEGGYIDYNVPVHPRRGQEFSVGDSVVYGFRNQVFVSRAKVAVVDGIPSSEPELLGLFDRNGNLIGEREEPLGVERTKELMDRI